MMVKVVMVVEYPVVCLISSSSPPPPSPLLLLLFFFFFFFFERILNTNLHCVSFSDQTSGPDTLSFLVGV